MAPVSAWDAEWGAAPQGLPTSSVTAMPHSLPRHPRPSGAKETGQGVSVTVQSQKPPCRGVAGPAAQKPLCHHVWVLGESSWVRKHQPKGPSGAKFRNHTAPAPHQPPPHRYGPIGVSPGSRHHLSNASPHSATGCGVQLIPEHPSLPELPCPSRPTNLPLNPKSIPSWVPAHSKGNLFL